MSYGTDAPAYWDPSLAGDPASLLGPEQCVINDEHFFLRGRLVVPVLGTGEDAVFEWGVWVSLSRANYARALKLWTAPEREQEQPYFGWLSTDLPALPAVHPAAEDAGAHPAARQPVLGRTGTDLPSPRRRAAHWHHAGTGAGNRRDAAAPARLTGPAGARCHPGRALRPRIRKQDIDDALHLPHRRADLRLPSRWLEGSHAGMVPWPSPTHHKTPRSASPKRAPRRSGPASRSAGTRACRAA